MQAHDGKGKQRAAYAMLGRMEVPQANAKGPTGRPAADGKQQQQPPPLSGCGGGAGREVYILAAADAVEEALNSHGVLPPGLHTNLLCSLSRACMSRSSRASSSVQ